MTQSIKALLILILISILSLQAQTQPYVVLISFDGFRWDYANRGITPNLDFIRENGVSATSLRPCFPSKTFPNHTSIITGMYPEHHGIISNNFKDYFTGKYYRSGDTVETRDSRWYKGEAIWETAERQGIITASYFWPGSDVNVSHRRPTYYHHYEHLKPYKERIDSVVGYLQLSYDKRPHFITTYFDATDTYGHNQGPNSLEVNQSIARLDSVLGYLIQELKEINFLDSTNIVVVSDHGMTEIDAKQIINVEEILNGHKYESGDNGSFMLIEPEDGEAESIYNKLKENESHYGVYYKEDVPDYYHYSDSPLISRIVIIAENGWGVETNKSIEKIKKQGSKGNHGYDPYWTDMNGIFFAMGPSFKRNYRIGTINNIDIYPMLCEIFNIIPNQLIDGRLERIGYVLK